MDLDKFGIESYEVKRFIERFLKAMEKIGDELSHMNKIAEK